MSKVSDVLPPPVKKTNRAVFKKGNRKLTASDSLLLKCSEVISSEGQMCPHPPQLPKIHRISVITLFGKTMSQMIKAIPDGISKEMAKIDCQQVLLRYRFQQPIQQPIRQPSYQQFSQQQGTKSIYSSDDIPVTGSHTQTGQYNQSVYQELQVPQQTVVPTPISMYSSPGTPESAMQSISPISPTYDRFLNVTDPLYLPTTNYNQ